MTLKEFTEIVQSQYSESSFKPVNMDELKIVLRNGNKEMDVNIEVVSVFSGRIILSVPNVD